MTKKTLAKSAPAKKAPAKVAPAKKEPAKKAPVKVAPVKKEPAKKAPVKVAPVKKAPVKVVPVKKAPAKKAPVKVVPVKKAPAKKAPVKVVPVKKAPAKKAPAKVAPVKKAPVQQAPATKAPATRGAAKTVTAKATVAPIAAVVAAVAPPAALPKLAPATTTLEKRSPEPELRALPPAPRARVIVAAPGNAPSLPAPLKRARAVNRPDPHGADALFLAHATAAGLEGATVEQAWARMPLFAPLVALALVRQGADALVHATIRAAATDVPDADLVDALSALSAPSHRAAMTLVEARDEATLARKPARAALLDAIQHALEGALAREEGAAVEAYARGIEIGRALTAAVALGRRRDASDPGERAEIVRALHERLKGIAPALPAIG